MDEVLDSLSHEFLLVRIKRELDEINDPERLRSCCLQLVTLCETQKAIFKQLLYSLIDENPEAQELFE